MEKARPFVLILAIFITFQYLFPPVKPQPLPEQKPATQEQSAITTAPAAATPSTEPTAAATTPVAPTATIAILDDIILENKLVKINLSNNGAVVTKVTLLEYFADVAETENLTLLDAAYGRASFGTRLTTDAPLTPWEAVEQSTTRVLFRRPDATGLILEKEFTLTPKGDLRVKNSIINPTTNTIAIAPQLDGPAGIEIEPSALLGASSQPFVYGVREDDAIELEDSDLKEIQEDGYRESVSSRLKWFSLRSKYFTAAAMLDDASNYDKITASYISQGADEELKESIATTLVAKTSNLTPQQRMDYNFEVYLGAISRDVFAEKPYTTLEPLADLGRLAPICGLLIAIINLFYSIVGNYGVAILLVTLVVKLTLHPLTAKGMRSMYAMQKLGPKLKALKEKYGDDRQRFGMEQMKLFKQEEVNPMMGCIPMLLQMPVYIALYTTLTRVIEVRHAAFLWIDDLSKADALFSFGTTLPLLGDTFNLLPLMWMTSMFFQQKMTPKSPDPNMAQQQKMMQFIPFVFGFMMYTMPSGLMLYWVAQNIFSIIEQAKIRKKYMPKPAH